MQVNIKQLLDRRFTISLLQSIAERLQDSFHNFRYEDALLKLKAAFKVESKEHTYYSKLMGDICHCQMKVTFQCCFSPLVDLVLVIHVPL